MPKFEHHCFFCFFFVSCCLRVSQVFWTFEIQLHRDHPVPWLPQQSLPPQHVHPVAAESRPKLPHQAGVWYHEPGGELQEWFCQNLRLPGCHWESCHGRVSLSPGLLCWQSSIHFTKQLYVNAVTLGHRCQTQAHEPNLAPGVNKFGPRDLYWREL